MSISWTSFMPLLGPVFFYTYPLKIHFWTAYPWHYSFSCYFSGIPPILAKSPLHKPQKQLPLHCRFISPNCLETTCKILDPFTLSARNYSSMISSNLPFLLFNMIPHTHTLKKNSLRKLHIFHNQTP